MKSILKKQIISLVILIIIAIMLSLGVGMLFKLIESRSSRVQEIKEQIPTYEINKHAFSDETKKIKELQLRYQNLEGFVVTEKKLPSVLTTIESLASANALSLDVTEVATPIKNNVTTLVIEFTAQGGYDALQTFFQALTQQPYAIAFSRLELVANTAQEDLAAVSTNKKSVQKAVPVQKWRAFATVTILSF